MDAITSNLLDMLTDAMFTVSSLLSWFSSDAPSSSSDHHLIGETITMEEYEA